MRTLVLFLILVFVPFTAGCATTSNTSVPATSSVATTTPPATFTVHSIGFDSSCSDYPPPVGDRRIIADVTITNGNGPPYVVALSRNFYLYDAGGYRYPSLALYTCYKNPMASGSLLAGQSRRGQIMFEVRDTPGMTYTLELRGPDPASGRDIAYQRLTGIQP